MSAFQHLFCLLDEGEDFFFRLGAEHGDAGLAIIGDALEEWGGGEMATDMKDAAQFGVFAVYNVGGITGSTVNTDCYLLLEDVYFLIKRKRLFGMCYFLEYPRPTEGGTTYHHGIHAIAFEGLPGLFCLGDVAVADNGDVHAGIDLDKADVRPVGIACVHL